LLLLTAIFATTPFHAARAEESAPPLKGAQITISIGYGAGGGFDLYSRLLARFIGKHIPGNPTIIAQNVVGAGSLKLANNLYAQAPRDGTAIGMVAQTLPVDQLLGSPGISFDYSKFNAIGRMATSGTVVISRQTIPVKSIEDVKNLPVAIAATGPSSEAFIVPALLNNLIGTKFNIIGGYAGTQEMMIALERGEADAATVIISSLMSQFSRFMKNKEVNVLVQNSLQRDPAFPEVPTTVELARNDDDRQIMKLFAVGSDIGRSIIAPPGVPAERVAILRRAFMDTMNDPEFIAAAKKSEFDLEPMNGADLQSMINGIGGMQPELLRKAAEAKKWSR
jgi:tripartite-type tricarboxylate transporter receptor subunit TctC